MKTERKNKRNASETISPTGETRQFFFNSYKSTTPFFSTPTVNAKKNEINGTENSETNADAIANKMVQQNQAASIQRKWAACEEENEKKVQKKNENNSTQVASGSIESNLNSSKGGGSSLPEAVRAQMEGSFGADFSEVRLHNDNSAVQMNKDLSAQAFTHGSHIYFNSGKFDANSNSGKHLLAHELTHTLQQRSSSKSLQMQSKGQKDGEIMVKWLEDDGDFYRNLVATIGSKFNVPSSALYQPVFSVYRRIYNQIASNKSLITNGKIKLHINFSYEKGEFISKVDITIVTAKTEEVKKPVPACAMLAAPDINEGGQYLSKVAAFYSRMFSRQLESTDRGGYDGAVFTITYEGVDLIPGFEATGSISSKYQSKLPYLCEYSEPEHLKPFFDAILIALNSYKPENIYAWKIIFKRDTGGKMDFVKWYLDSKPKYPTNTGQSEADELRALGIPDRKQIYAQIFADAEAELKSIGIAITGFTIEQVVFWVAGGVLFKAIGLLGKGAISAFPKIMGLIRKGNPALFAKASNSVLKGAEQKELAALMQKVESGVLTGTEQSRLNSLLAKVEANLPSSLAGTSASAASALSKIKIPKVTSFTGTASKFDTELVRRAAEIRATQAGLSLDAFKTYNVAVARVRTADGSIVYLEAGNLPGAAHSEEYILGQFKERALGLGSGARIEQLYSERIPCANCSSVIQRFFGAGTEIYYTVGNQANRGKLLMEAYGL